MKAPEASYALNLSCRDGNERTAVACTRDSLGCYSGADLAFKKIDSLLRGHWAAELAEIVKSCTFRRIVLAPAVPAQGRLTRDGLQMLAHRLVILCSSRTSRRSLCVMAFRLVAPTATCSFSTLKATPILTPLRNGTPTNPRRCGAAPLDWRGPSRKNPLGRRAR
jgi:Sugar-binding N-terminal domain